MALISKPGRGGGEGWRGPRADVGYAVTVRDSWDRAPGGQGPHGLNEGQAVQALDEVDDVAVGSAAEAGEPVGDGGDR